MLTDRMSSGPSQVMGDLNLAGALNRRTKVQEKGPESFASVLDKKPMPEKERSVTPQKPNTGQNEAGSRTDKDLSVKRKDPGAEENSSAKSSDDSESHERDDVGSKEGKAGKVHEKLAGDRSKKGLSQRQKVMHEFMDSIESEFGIPPERMVEAMAQLNDKSLLKAPEETASQVISDLKLPPETADKVEARYVDMLTKLSDIDRRRPERILEPTVDQMAMIQAMGGLAGLSGVAAIKKGQNGEPTVVTVKDNRMLLNNSIVKLSDKFFLNNEPEIMAKGNLEKIETQPLMVPNPDLNSDKLEQLGLPGQGLDVKGAMDFNQGKQLPGMNGPGKMSNESYQDLATRLAAVGVTAGALNAAIKGDPATRAALKMEQNLQGQNSNLLGTGVGVNHSLLAGANAISGNAAGAGAGGEFSTFSEGGNSSGHDNGRDSVDFASGKAGEMLTQNSASNFKADFAAAVGLAGASATAGKNPEATENIRQLMNQAEYVIKKGGGEAVVKLNPEGLGEVHLRVAVSDGKVNLQMSAQTSEAKNLIESSLKDLQASLSTHNLKVDHIKVDVGNQSSAENGNMHKQDFNFDQGREQARNFLNNFQEENFNNRGNFYESPGLRAYNPNKSPEPMRPSSESVSARRFVGEGRGTGLNLVA